MKNIIAISVLAVVILAGGAWLTRSGALEGASGDKAALVSVNGLHWHSEISIFIDGEPYQVPANIGLIGGHNPMHTHEEDNVIHLEFDSVVREDDITLGKFFELWGKEFSSTELLDREGEVTLLVNGEPNTEFGDYILQDGDKIEIHI